MKVILEDESLIDKGVKMAYSAVKTKIVALLTGNGVLSTIGTILDLLSFLPGVDRKVVDDKMKELSDFLHGGIENMDKLLAKVPLLEKLFGDDKDCIKNVLRFMVFAQQISLGSYPSDQYDLENVVAVQSTFIALVALWTVFGAACVASGGAATVVAWVIKDICVACYNEVFPMVEPDIKKFQNWAKENKVDTQKISNDLKAGKVDVKKEQKLVKETFGGIRWIRL